jgi:hypothetical protein
MSDLATQIAALSPPQQFELLKDLVATVLPSNAPHIVADLTDILAQLSLYQKFKVLTALQRELLPPANEPHYVVYNLEVDSDLEVSVLQTSTSSDIMKQGMADRELASQVLYVSDANSTMFEVNSEKELYSPSAEAGELYRTLEYAGIAVNGVVVKYSKPDSVQALVPIIKTCPGFSGLSTHPTTIEMRYIMMYDTIRAVMPPHFN